MQILEADKAEPWLDRVRVPGADDVIERVFVVHVAAYDWNCPQHITPRYTAEEIREAVHAIEARVSAVEQENDVLRRKLAELQSPG